MRRLTGDAALPSVWRAVGALSLLVFAIIILVEIGTRASTSANGLSSDDTAALPIGGPPQ